MSTLVHHSLSIADRGSVMLSRMDAPSSHDGLAMSCTRASWNAQLGSMWLRTYRMPEMFRWNHVWNASQRDPEVQWKRYISEVITQWMTSTNSQEGAFYQSGLHCKLVRLFAS